MRYRLTILPAPQHEQRSLTVDALDARDALRKWREQNGSSAGWGSVSDGAHVVTVTLEGP